MFYHCWLLCPVCVHIVLVTEWEDAGVKKGNSLNRNFLFAAAVQQSHGSSSSSSAINCCNYEWKWIKNLIYFYDFDIYSSLIRTTTVKPTQFSNVHQSQATCYAKLSNSFKTFCLFGSDSGSGSGSGSGSDSCQWKCFNGYWRPKTNKSSLEPLQIPWQK